MRSKSESASRWPAYTPPNAGAQLVIRESLTHCGWWARRSRRNRSPAQAALPEGTDQFQLAPSTRTPRLRAASTSPLRHTTLAVVDTGELRQPRLESHRAATRRSMSGQCRVASDRLARRDAAKPPDSTNRANANCSSMVFPMSSNSFCPITSPTSQSGTASQPSRKAGVKFLLAPPCRPPAAVRALQGRRLALGHSGIRRRNRLR